MQIDESQDDGSARHSLIDELIDEYVTLKQSGEAPSISEYCRRYPQLDSQIRELFPMLSILEGVKRERPVSQMDPVPTPEKIGAYVLLREIGRGGMGVVYEALDTVVGRHVALKSLPQRLSSDPRALARFEREARAIGGIHHTNVVPLFEFGQDNGHYYLAMQLIDGQSLDKLIVRLRENSADTTLQGLVNRVDNDAEGESVHGEIEPSDTRSASGVATQATTGHASLRDTDVAAIGLQIASALDYAHRKGIVHRDVKPSNILLDRDGIAWLTDFGLAKTDEEELTQTSDFLGTLRYTAPERFRGQCDNRSDLYALGLTLYELIVCQPAFSGADRIQLIHAIESSSPQALRKLDPTIPRDLETIVTKAIQHDPARRYVSAGELAADLQRFLADEPILARQMTAGERLLRWRRRSPALANALTLLMVLMVVMFVGVVRNTMRESRLRRQAEEAVEVANESRKVLQQTLYFAEMNLAGQASLAAGGINRVLDLLGHWKPSEQRPEVRGWEWYYLESLCHREQSVFTPESTISPVNEVAWNPAGTRLAIAQANGRITVRDVQSGAQVMSLVGNDSAVLTIAWSPDESMLASGNLRGTLLIWDTNSGSQLRTLQCEPGEIRSLRWSPDSRQLAWGLGQSIYVGDASYDWEPRRIGSQSDVFSVNVIQWSPDGTHLFAGNWWQNGGGIWNVSHGQQVQQIPGRFVKWKSTGHDVQYWLSADNTGGIQIWEADQQRPVHSLRGHSAAIRSFDWSPDGLQLMSASDDRSLRIWELDSGSVLDVLEGHKDQVFHALWNPQGTRAASAGKRGDTLIWDVPGGPIRTLVGPHTRVQHIAWRPQGDLLASASRDGDVHLWDAAEHRLITVLAGYPRQVESVAWCPDGKQLATADREGTLRIWNANTYECVQELEGHHSVAWAVAWHPTADYIASTGDDCTVRIWNLAGPLEESSVWQMPDAAQCVAWNPLGTLVAAGDKVGVVHLWDSVKQEPVASWNGHEDAIVDLAWSPDGRRLATSSADDTTKIWNVADGSVHQVIQGHLGPVWSVDWNPAGDRLATSSRDGTVRIWDPVTGKQALSLSGIRQTGEFWCVRWSPDGMKVSAGSANGTVTVWDATLGYVYQGERGAGPDKPQ